MEPQKIDDLYYKYWKKMYKVLLDNYLCKKEEYARRHEEGARERALIYSEILTLMIAVEEDKI